MLVRHLNKAMDASAVYRGGGSIGIVGAARSGLLAARHPDDGDRRILASTKCNFGPQPPSLVYRLEGHANGAGYVIWKVVTTHTADALVSQPQGYEERTAREEAIDFLRDALASGPVSPKEILRQARDADINEKTLRRTKTDLGVTKRREGFGPDGVFVWELPSPIDGQPTPIDAIDRHPKMSPSMGDVVHLWSGRDSRQPSEHPDQCWTCKGTKWHRRADGGGPVCSTCHPPAREGGP